MSDKDLRERLARKTAELHGRDFVAAGHEELVDTLLSELADAGHEWRNQWHRAKELVLQQADDSGLWFEAQTAPEAYLQQELRSLHEAVEGRSAKDCVLAVLSSDEEEEGS